MSRLCSATFGSLLRGVSAVKPGSTRGILPRRVYSQNANDVQTKVTQNETFTGHHLYKNERRPTEFDKRVLMWSGRYKKKQDIPEFVSWEVISAAKSNFRIKMCMGMIIFTIVGSIWMARSGKKALKQENTLLQRNVERKATLREEASGEQTTSIKSH